tara:strand:+ start:2548 stop:2748 length:201 start_codon:yes stop_codon:yes gene_type:complete
MTYNEINETIRNGHLMATSQIYKNLEQLDIMLSYSFRNLTSEEHNLVIASKLFLEYQLTLRGGENA